MGFDFNSVLNTEIENNTYIDNVQWDLRLDNLFYMLSKSKNFKLWDVKITKDDNNNMEINYIAIDDSYELYIQLKHEGPNQLIPYIEYINYYKDNVTEKDIAENICNFLTNLFKVIKEYSLIHIDRIFIKPEIVEQEMKCLTIFNSLFVYLHNNNFNVDISIDSDYIFDDGVNSIFLMINDELGISYDIYQLIMNKTKQFVPFDNFQIQNSSLREKSISDIKKLEEWLIFLQNTNVYENINTNKMSNILFNMCNENTLQYYIKRACNDLNYDNFNPWYYITDYLTNKYNNDIIETFIGVIYAFISGCNIQYIIDQIKDKHKIQLLKEVNNVILNDIKNKGFIYQNILSFYKKEVLNQ